MAVGACNVNFVNVYVIAYRLNAHIPITFTESESRFV